MAGYCCGGLGFPRRALGLTYHNGLGENIGNGVQQIADQPPLPPSGVILPPEMGGKSEAEIREDVMKRSPPPSKFGGGHLLALFAIGGASVYLISKMSKGR